MSARAATRGRASSTTSARARRGNGTVGERRTRQRNQRRFRSRTPTTFYETDVGSDDESDASSSEHESDDAQFQAAALYRDLSRQVHRNHVCPFSDPSQPNPCNTFSKVHTRKDAITNHLRAFKFDGYDETHPEDDPLWKSELVERFYLVSEPPKLSIEQKKRRVKHHNHKNYTKRLQRQNDNLDEWNQQFLSGELSAADMKKRLVGNVRREFVFKLDLQSRIEEKEAQLRQELVAGGSTSTDTRASLASINKLKGELNSANERSAAYGATLSSLLKSVVGFWDASRQNTVISALNGSEDTELLEEHRGWKWPNTPSIDAFYEIAAFLAKVDDTDNIRSESHIREMKGRLHQYLAQQRQRYEGPQEWDSLEAIFNRSVDLVVAAEERYTQYDDDDAAAWYASQDEVWNRALKQAKVAWMPTFVNKAPVEVAAQVDNMAVMWQAHVEAIAASKRLTSQMEELIS